MRERVRELSNRARYCTMVHDGALSVVRKKVAERITDLDAAGMWYIPMCMHVCLYVCMCMYVYVCI